MKMLLKTIGLGSLVWIFIVLLGFIAFMQLAGAMTYIEEGKWYIGVVGILFISYAYGKILQWFGRKFMRQDGTEP